VVSKGATVGVDVVFSLPLIACFIYIYQSLTNHKYKYNI